MTCDHEWAETVAVKQDAIVIWCAKCGSLGKVTNLDSKEVFAWRTPMGDQGCEVETKPCVSCGAPSTHECQAMNGMICGAPICDDCGHSGSILSFEHRRLDGK